VIESQPSCRNASNEPAGSPRPTYRRLVIIAIVGEKTACYFEHSTIIHFSAKTCYMSRPLPDESAFRTVAHPVRRRVLDMLRKGERTVGEIVGAFRLNRQTMSQHLRILRTSGLDQQHRKGRTRVYQSLATLITSCRRSKRKRRQCCVIYVFQLKHV
jgi:DNA-binding transcriptional ArsR family regulator